MKYTYVHIAMDNTINTSPLCGEEVIGTNIIGRRDILTLCEEFRLIEYACIPCQACMTHRLYDLKVLEFSL